MWAAIISTIAAIGGGIVNIFNKRTADVSQLNAEKAAESIAQTAAQTETLKQQGNIVLAEARGESWLQRNWRPSLMFLLIFIVANNTVGVVYLHATVIVMTDQMWNLLTYGVTGYIGCRTVEKVAKILRG